MTYFIPICGVGYVMFGPLCRVVELIENYKAYFVTFKLKSNKIANIAIMIFAILEFYLLESNSVTNKRCRVWRSVMGGDGAWRCVTDKMQQSSDITLHCCPRSSFAAIRKVTKTKNSSTFRPHLLLHLINLFVHCWGPVQLPGDIMVQDKLRPVSASASL